MSSSFYPFFFLFLFFLLLFLLFLSFLLLIFSCFLLLNTSFSSCSSSYFFCFFFFFFFFFDLVLFHVLCLFRQVMIKTRLSRAKQRPKWTVSFTRVLPSHVHAAYPANKANNFGCIEGGTDVWTSLHVHSELRHAYCPARTEISAHVKDPMWNVETS